MPGPCWCTRLITRAWKNRLYRLPPKKDYHVYITPGIYHYVYVQQTQVNWQKETIKEKGKEMGAWGQEKEKVNTFWGVYWRICHQNDATWFFDDLQQYYERLPIHPPKHGLTANYAIDSWLWLSCVYVLGAPVRCHLLALVWVKHAVCSMVSRQQHTRIRTSARTTYLFYRRSNIFSLSMRAQINEKLAKLNFVFFYRI